MFFVIQSCSYLIKIHVISDYLSFYVWICSYILNQYKIKFKISPNNPTLLCNLFETTQSNSYLQCLDKYPNRKSEKIIIISKDHFWMQIEIKEKTILLWHCSQLILQVISLCYINQIYIILQVISTCYIYQISEWHIFLWDN